MGISTKSLESLVDSVVLPFEKFIMEAPKLAEYLSDPEVSKVHNMAVAKLTVYIYSDIKRAYAYIEEGAKAHRKKHIPVHNLQEFYSLYFVLCREWNQNQTKPDDTFTQNLAIIEEFVFESFAYEGESKEDFFIYGSDTIKEDMAKMHYKDEAKITAEAFYAEGSMDDLDRQDILECAHELSEIVHDKNIDYDEGYFTRVYEHFLVYAAILEKNIDFRDLGFSLSKLSQFLEKNLSVLPNHSKKKAILVILGSIVEDMLSWVKTVLQERTAVDIHYLDASLLSSTIQFEMMFSASQEEAEDDLEFF